MKIFIFSIFVLTLGIQSFAQPFNYCNSILEGGIYNNYQHFSTTEYDNMVIDNFCNVLNSSSSESMFASASGGLPIPEINKIVDITGTLSWNEKKTRYQRICNHHQVREQFRQLIRRNESTIDAGIVAAWSKCIEDGTWRATLIPEKVNPVGVSWDSFTLTVRNKTDRGNFKVTSIAPNTITCYSTIDGKVKNVIGQKFSNLTETFTCHKSALNSGQELIMNIATNIGGSRAIRIPGDEDTFKRLQNAITSNMQQIELLSEKLKEHAYEFQADFGSEFINSELSNIKANTNSVYVKNVQGGTLRKTLRHCPDGYYVAGIIENETDGGKYCTTCISNVHLICRPLPIPENNDKGDIELIYFNK